MTKIILAQKKEMCCGCGACMVVCPVKAIEMVPEELGSLYPQIDHDRCIQCHVCENACAYTKQILVKENTPKVFAVAAQDENVLKKSSSGGVFASLAHAFLNAGGIVYGCSLETVNGTLTPIHIGIENHGDIKKLQGSKYVQSSLGTVLSEVRHYLEMGRPVLFSGTPCQVAALKHYLQCKDTENLYTIDLICHGVPSAALFNEYLQMLENHKGGKVTDFSFRNKALGCGLNACYTIDKGEGRQKEYQMPSDLSSYYSLFLEAETYRSSCYSCRYANKNRVGDITIGDFWCIEREHAELLSENGGKLDVDKGISAVLVNNAQGERMLKNFGQKMDVYNSELGRVAKWNRQLQGPSTHTDLREKLIAKYNSDGYAGIEKVFRNRMGLKYPARSVKAIIQQIIKT